VASNQQESSTPTKQQHVTTKFTKLNSKVPLPAPGLMHGGHVYQIYGVQECKNLWHPAGTAIDIQM